MKTNKITYGNQWKSLKTVQTINSLGFANILLGFPQTTTAFAKIVQGVARTC